MTVWKLVYGAGALVLSAILIAATTHYNYTLGSSEVMFSVLGMVAITNAYVMGSLGFAFASLMVASFIGIFYWKGVNATAMISCIVVFIISSLFDVHSLRGYIQTNIVQVQAPKKQKLERKNQLQENLKIARQRLVDLHSVTIKGTHWRAVKAREDHNKKIDQQQKRVDALTETITNIKAADIVHPVNNSAWLLAFLFWGIHTVLWKGVSGAPPKPRKRAPVNTHDVGSVNTKKECSPDPTHLIEKANENKVVNIHQNVHPAPKKTSFKRWVGEHLNEPVKAKDLYEKYCSSDCTEAHSMQSFGKALAGLGVNKKRMREGIHYLPFEQGCELHVKAA